MLLTIANDIPTRAGTGNTLTAIPLLADLVRNAIDDLATAAL